MSFLAKSHLKSWPSTMSLSLAFLFSLLAILSSAYDESVANLGDVRLKYAVKEGTEEMYGQAQIWFTDGLASPTWSSICKDMFGNDEAKVFCNEMGYQEGKVKPEPQNSTDGSDPSWLTNVECPKNSNYSHILHCEKDIKSNNTRCSSGHVWISCYIPIIKSDSKNLYNGQVILCPPDSIYDSQGLRDTTVSFGIVSMRLFDDWGAICEPAPSDLLDHITDFRANLICQQMGFQQAVPGSVRTLSTVLSSSSHTFDNCFDSKNEFGPQLSFSWINTSTLDCSLNVYYGGISSSFDPCFGCCYKHPAKGSQNPNCKENYVVMKCMYNPFYDSYVPYGNLSSCSFKANADTGDRISKYSSICAAGIRRNDGKVVGISVGVIATVIIIIIIIIIIILLCNKDRLKKLKYKKLEGSNE